MSSNTSVVALDLSGQGLEDEVGVILARMLITNTTLRKLDVEGNNFGPSTASAFGEALSRNKTLVYLSLQSNPITRGAKDTSGIEALADMMENNTTLLGLNLSNTAIGPKGGKFIAQSLEVWCVLFIRVP
jgi:Ran GTPase-activating protein (RanGAP) involved in mRNA processing and transport